MLTTFHRKIRLGTSYTTSFHSWMLYINNFIYRKRLRRFTLIFFVHVCTIMPLIFCMKFTELSRIWYKIHPMMIIFFNLTRTFSWQRTILIKKQKKSCENIVVIKYFDTLLKWYECQPCIVFSTHFFCTWATPIVNNTNLNPQCSFIINP